MLINIGRGPARGLVMLKPHDPPILPPNQALAAPGKWPVVGESAPLESADPWTLSIAGLVAQPNAWALDDLTALPRQSLTTDIHCVTRWSRLGVTFDGIPLTRVLEMAGGALPEARFVQFVARSPRAHSTSLPLDVALSLGTLLTFTHQGQPLDRIHGGPVRTIVPGRYFYKSVKWLTRIVLLAEDQLGYWEGAAGYHNNADPWLEERYIARGIARRDLETLVRTRDIRGRDLLGLAAPLMDLSGLDARGALLRNADFTQTQLTGARFDGANLSNGHFRNAILTGASFVDADLEGADFSGADLRGADLRGASLFGTTFETKQADGEHVVFARIDETTTLSSEELSRLTPDQQIFVNAHMRKKQGDL
jgi:DMSO/TMAO reductase YedYZ molybdopterin-dependent catalytic subunit